MTLIEINKDREIDRKIQSVTKKMTTLYLYVH